MTTLVLETATERAAGTLSRMQAAAGKILGNKQPHVSVLTRNRSCSQDRTLADFDRRLVILAFFDIDQWISTIDCDIVFFDCDRNIDVFFD
jgi:hypothetical protein